MNVAASQLADPYDGLEADVPQEVALQEVALQEVALHTRLKPGAEAEYDAVHAVVPPRLDSALREAGVVSWKIWRSGRDLFHVVTCHDYASMRAFLREHPDNVPWQARMAELLEVEDDYSGGDDGLGLVWRLPDEPPAAL